MFQTTNQINFAILPLMGIYSHETKLEHASFSNQMLDSQGDPVDPGLMNFDETTGYMST